MRESLRVLYRSGRFAEVEADATVLPSGGVVVEFRTKPNYFNGNVTVTGLPKGGPNDSEVVSTAGLELGDGVHGREAEGLGEPHCAPAAGQRLLDGAGGCEAGAARRDAAGGRGVPGGGGDAGAGGQADGDGRSGADFRRGSGDLQDAAGSAGATGRAAARGGASAQAVYAASAGWRRS